MSDGIQKEPVSPFQTNAPAERPHRLNFGSEDEQGIPRSVKAAGLLWLVCGGLVVLSIVGMFLLTASLAFESPEKGTLVVHLGSWAAGCASIPLGLFAAALLLFGARTRRGTAAGTRVSGVSSLVIGVLFLLYGLSLLANGSFELWNFPPELFNGRGDVGFGVEKLANTVPLLLMGALLLTAGCLALAGANQYELWRQSPWPGGFSRRRFRLIPQ